MSDSEIKEWEARLGPVAKGWTRTIYVLGVWPSLRDRIDNGDCEE